MGTCATASMKTTSFNCTHTSISVTANWTIGTVVGAIVYYGGCRHQNPSICCACIRWQRKFSNTKTCSNAIIINSKWIRCQWLNGFPFIFGFYFWQLKASASSVLVFSLMHSEHKYTKARTHAPNRTSLKCDDKLFSEQEGKISK